MAKRKDFDDDLLKKVEFSKDGEHYIPHIREDPKVEETIRQHTESIGRISEETRYQLMGNVKTYK